MNKWRLWFLFSYVLCIWQPAFSYPEKMLVTGTASDSQSAAILYREYHDITRERHDVRYVDPAEKLFASKAISYQHGFSTPEYKLQDRRFHRITGNEWKDGHFVVYRQENSGSPHTQNVKPSSNLVIDAGFDYFIRSHWDALVNGKVLTFSFAIADPLTVLDMKIEEVDTSDTAIQHHSDQYRYFRVRSNNPLIGWAMPEIHLAYNHHSHLLQIYQGPSNLTDKHDKSQTVLITYEYQYPMTQTTGEKIP